MKRNRILKIFIISETNYFEILGVKLRNWHALVADDHEELFSALPKSAENDQLVPKIGTFGTSADFGYFLIKLGNFKAILRVL